MSAMVLALSWVVIRYAEAGYQPLPEGDTPGHAFMIWNWPIWVALPWWLIAVL